ncbi:phage tail tape measure protein [Streptomyces noursei]|uniref:phage tail tape measure protein n=1 Tax=Streptomyces noursei TaxID=1971 RepID=UPI00382C1A22
MAERSITVLVRANTADYAAGMAQAAARTRALADAARFAGAGVRGMEGHARRARGGLTQVAQGAAASERSLSALGTTGTGALGSLRGGITSAMAPMAGFATLMGTGLGLATVIEQGNQFNTTVESWGVITGATRDELQQMRTTAKALGNDMDLPKSTAADAAQAMLELSKSGFTARDSMASARDTIVLATAAEVEIGDAAMMASDMMQQFGLSAKETARVTDTLTNAANASSISLVDVYNSMKYAGPPAKALKISLEDVATAIAGMGNAGVKGEMAGTQLRGSLSRLAKPTRQMHQAMKKLNLVAFDQEGRFKGLRYVTETLTKAKKNLSDKEFIAATQATFGMEAYTGWVAIAEQGLGVWDKNAAKIREQGSALELARAKTKGLGGAMAGLQSQLTAAGTAIYESIAPPLEKGTRAVGNLVNKAIPLIPAAFNKAKEAVTGFAGLVGDAFHTVEPALMPVVSTVGSAASAFASLPGPIMASVAASAGIVLMRNRIQSMGSSIAAIPGQFRDAARASQTMATSTAAGTIQLGRFGQAVGAIGQRVPVIAQMQSAFINSAVGANRFGRTAGTAAAATVGLRAAGAGLVGLLGGPMGVALTGATLAAGLWADANAKAKEKAAEHAESVARFKDALLESNGAISSNVKSLVIQEMQQTKVGDTGKNMLRVADDLGIAHRRLYDAVMTNGPAYNDLKAHLQDVVKEGTSYNTTQYNTQVVQTAAAKSAQRLLDELGVLRGKFTEGRDGAEEYRKALSEATPYTSTLTDALKKLGDSSASAADKTSALKQALDILQGKQQDAQQATDSHRRAVREHQEAVKQAAKDTGVWGNALLDSKGALDVSHKAADGLKTSLDRLKEAALAQAQAAYESGEYNGTKYTSGLKAAEAAMKDNRDAALQMARDYGISRDKAEQLVNQLGLIPADVKSVLTLAGAGTVTRELAGIKQLLDQQKDRKVITVQALTKDAEGLLTQLGFKVERLPDGTVKVTAQTAEAWEALRNLNGAELADKVQKLKGDASDAKAKHAEVNGLSLGDKIQKFNGDASDALRKQADAIRKGKELEAQNPTQHLRGDGSGASAARQSAYRGGAQLNNTVFTQHLSGDESGARQARLTAQAGGNQLERDRKTQHIDGDNSAAWSAIRAITSFVMPTKTISIVADVVGKAKELLGFSAGGIVEAYADGGIRGVRAPRRAEAHSAQIAHAGAYRVWSEPETGGEAYIPLGPAKRARSKKITEDVVARFGGQVAWTPTVRQAAPAPALPARVLDQMVTAVADAISAARAGPQGPALHVEHYHQSGGASASQVAAELDWKLRTRLGR